MKRKITLFLFIGLIIFGCKEKIDLTLDSSYTRLVVEGAVTDEARVQSVMLTLTSDYLSNKPSPRVSGAVVKIIEINPADQSENIIPLAESEPGLYITQGVLQGIPGRLYKVFIQNVTIGNTIQEYESYPELLTSAPPIDSLLLRINSAHEKWNISISFRDNVATRDFYMFNFARNGIIQTDTISDIAYASDEYFNGQYLSLDRVHRGITNLKYGDTVTEYLSVIPERFYKFLVAANAEAEPDVPLFAGPPANVPGNINKGALGFFNVYSVSKATTIAKHR